MTKPERTMYRRSKGIFLFLLIIFILNQCQDSESLHLQGTWNNEDFFIFLSKFGFQEMEVWDKNDKGYIFGNITSKTWTDSFVNDAPKGRLERQIRSPAVIPNNSSQISTSVNNTINNGSTSTTKPSSTLISSSTKSNPITLGVNGTTVSTISTSLSTSIPKLNTEKAVVSSSSTTITTTTTTTTPIPIKKNVTTMRTTVAPKRGHVFAGTFVVLDRDLFVDYYRNRKTGLEGGDRDLACQNMFEQISGVMYDPLCFPEGKKFPTRFIPCPNNKICSDETTFANVVKGHQFTYAINDTTKAKFWYVSLVACYLDTNTCKWRSSKNFTSVDYDVWLVNGNPYTKNQNPLEYQFSFDRQDTVEIYLVFFLCYLVLVPLQVHAVLRQRHIVPRLFTGSVALELTAVLSNVIHVLTFSMDGEGYPRLAVFGDIMDILARAIFMLILLVLAKGWAVTRTELTNKPFVFSIWALYGLIHILLYVWNWTEVDVIEDIDEYQTWPGWLILILRTIIMLWFVYELKDTMDHEHQPHKLQFFLHFGAASLVWFIYLPIVALIALQVSTLWRSKLLLGITYSADCLAFAVMTHLLWPTRSQQYFLLASNHDTSLNDELEEFDEAPHVVNPYGRRRPNNWFPNTYAFRESTESVSLTQPSNGNGRLNHWNGNHHMNDNGNGNVLNNQSYIDDKDNLPLIIT